MKTKELFYIVTLVVLIVAAITMYFLDYRAAYANPVNDDKLFTVQKLNYNLEMEYYIPLGETSITMEELRALIQVCPFEADKLDSGTIIIKIKLDPHVLWVVGISDHTVIKELKWIEQTHRLTSTIPD